MNECEKSERQERVDQIIEIYKDGKNIGGIEVTLERVKVGIVLGLSLGVGFLVFVVLLSLSLM